MSRPARTIVAAAVAASAAIPSAAVADAVRVYDVDDYVQNGLVVHYDGIRNAGADAPHSDSATMWVNLGSTGVANDAALVEKDADAAPTGATAGSWNAKGYVFNAKNCFNVGDLVLGKCVTVQMATKYDAVSVRSAFKDSGLSWPTFFGSTTEDADSFAIFARKLSEDGASKLRCIPKNGKDMTQVQNWGGNEINVIYDAKNARGSLTTSGTHNWVSNAAYNDSLYDHNARRFAIGTGWKTDAEQKKRMLVGEVHAARVYDRVLSEAELAWNTVIDKQRYRTDEPPSLDDVNATLRSSVPLGDCVADFVGKYIVEGTHTFTAPETVEVGGKLLMPNGYTVETWDGAAWGEAVAYGGASYTATSAAKVRVTWLWAILEAYGLGDYVQSGLVAHYDGICNAGADATRDSSATTWVNLGSTGSANDGVLAVLTSPAAAATDGAWTDSGYAFGGKNYFNIGTLSLGNAVTVQAATDYDKSKCVSDYPAIVGGTTANKDNFVVWISKGNLHENMKILDVKYDNDKWDGRYMNSIYDGANKRMSLTSAVSHDWVTKTPSARVDSANTAYAIGTAQSSESKKAERIFRGTIKSVRIYDRVLKEEELEWNRRIDRLRFDGDATAVGGITVVNGAVGDSGTAGESSVADGTYKLESGTWTFSAENVVADGRRYSPRLVVETLVDGEWVRTARLWTDSYAVNKEELGDGGIRLTWTWEIKNGLSVIVR